MPHVAASHGSIHPNVTLQAAVVLAACCVSCEFGAMNARIRIAEQVDHRTGR